MFLMRATTILTHKMLILHIDILIEGSQCHTQSGRIVPNSPQEIMLSQCHHCPPLTPCQSGDHGASLCWNGPAKWWNLLSIKELWTLATKNSESIWPNHSGQVVSLVKKVCDTGVVFWDLVKEAEMEIFCWCRVWDESMHVILCLKAE